MNYVYLAIAIGLEVIATSALKGSEGFTKLGPSLISLIGYAIAFYCLSLTLRTIPVGIAYAIWSGAGVALVTLIGWIVFKQTLDLPAILGVALILVGVLVINIFSKTASH